MRGVGKIADASFLQAPSSGSALRADPPPGVPSHPSFGPRQGRGKVYTRDTFIDDRALVRLGDLGRLGLQSPLTSCSGRACSLLRAATPFMSAVSPSFCSNIAENPMFHLTSSPKFQLHLDVGR